MFFAFNSLDILSAGCFRIDWFLFRFPLISIPSYSLDRITSISATKRTHFCFGVSCKIGKHTVGKTYMQASWHIIHRFVSRLIYNRYYTSPFAYDTHWQVIWYENNFFYDKLWKSVLFLSWICAPFVRCSSSFWCVWLALLQVLWPGLQWMNQSKYFEYWMRLNSGGLNQEPN